MTPPWLPHCTVLGKQLHSWTINNASLMRSVLDVGVDAVVTNLPHMAMEAIESRLQQCGAMNRVEADTYDL